MHWPGRIRVWQYRARCRERERQLAAGAGSLPGRWEARGEHSLENALLRLEEEHQRCEDLAEANTRLQEHLDQANMVNSALQEDIGKLAADWMRAQKELELKESEWRTDRELYDSYVRGEHNRLLSLWRQVVTLRRRCLEVKTATDRDLSELKAEQMRLSGSLLVSCSHLNSGTQLWESVTARRPVPKEEAQPQVEQDISPKTWEVMCLQVTGDLEKPELQHRLKDLAALEGKHSSFQSELVVTRETLEELHLQSDLLKQEKHQLAPALEKVYRQQGSASSAREQLHQESSHQGHALAKASKEEELLVQEKAALQLRLAAMERDRQGLSEQLAEASSVKETLESSLFEAQQHLSQLKIQLGTVTQAKEAIQGEVKRLQCELEAERSVMRQERENTAQQLLRTRQQYDSALSLRQTDHQAAINKLLQDLASEREGHRSEMQQLLEQWEKEKAETEREHEKQLFEMKQEVAAVRAQQEEEKTRVENAKQEVLLEKEREKNALLETLLQTWGELTEACQQLEQLRREVAEQREHGQHERDRVEAVKEKLVREINLLQESVTASENRANTATEMNHCLEQELQTTVSILKIKNEEVETQWEKIQMLQKEAAQAKTLQETVPGLNAVLLEWEGQRKLDQDQMRMLEKQKETCQTTLDQAIKDIAEKKQKVESQQEQIRELEKQQEEQRIAVSKMSKVLEEREREIRSQQEQIRALEQQREMERTAVSKMSKVLEERDQEIKFQEGKIIMLEQHGASQVRNLRVDLDHLKRELEMEREQVKSLQASLEHLRAVLKDREWECDSQREQLRLLQQHKEEQEGDLQELQGKVAKMTLSLSEKDQELESQQKQIQEAEEVMHMQVRTVRHQLEQTLETLKEKDRLIDLQKQQARSYEEKTEEQRNVLQKDLEYSMAILKEKDFMIESQKEVIETFQKQEQDSEQQKEILHHLQAALKEKEQEILSLRKRCEACKEKEEKHEAEQRHLQATKRTLKEREKKIAVLEEAISKLQQQKEEAAMPTKAMLQRLEYAESSLEARDQEIASLQEHVQDLREQKQLEGKQAKRVEQDPDKASQIAKENHLEFLKQPEQMNMFQLRGESMRVALTSCQKQVNLLEEEVRKRDKDNKTLMQKLQRQEEELKTLQNLQLRLAEKGEGVRHPREQEKLLEEALHERERETKAQGEQKELEEEIRALREDLQHVQQTLTKKDEEIEYQRGRVRYLEETLTEREQELRRQSGLLKRLASALRWKDGDETLQKQIRRLQNWEEEEAEKRRVLQERDRSLQRQKELTQQLEDERRAKGKELEHMVAVLRQTESREVKWREKAQALALALGKSETAHGTRREETAVPQSVVSARDTDQCQQALAEGEQLSWLSEKGLLLQRLEVLQEAVARLEDEKTELKQLNAELRRTLEQVERERRRLKRCCRDRPLPDACGFSLPDQHRTPASRQEESPVCCSHR
ncbi:uncharacterized protein LOC142360521 [Opisthocomus hoazin]|uniref:uncharacterized protein LOC142360521 n=1 Tax=Opisthocomus hoazin TaxID=30419 RepID=UPI003F52B225